MSQCIAGTSSGLEEVNVAGLICSSDIAGLSSHSRR